MRLESDDNYVKIQCFAPKSAMNIPTSFKPYDDLLVKLGEKVDITIDGIVVTYSKGEQIILSEGIEYTFSSAVDVHIM